MNRRIFYKNNYFCIVTRDIGEIYEHFIERGYYIVSQIICDGINEVDYNKILVMSRIHSNEKINSCGYN